MPVPPPPLPIDAVERTRRPLEQAAPNRARDPTWQGHGHSFRIAAGTSARSNPVTPVK